MKMCIIMTSMMLNMKNKSQISASLKSDDFGRELIRVDKRDAKTRKPVMAPMNLLLKSLVLINKVK